MQIEINTLDSATDLNKLQKKLADALPTAQLSLHPTEQKSILRIHQNTI